MIRNAVLHLFNEQPLVADLYRLPSVGDLGLVCTNLRQLNGSRPVFIDDVASTFFFPYAQIRFVEIPARSLAAAGVDPGAGRQDPAAPIVPGEGSALVPLADDAKAGRGPAGTGDDARPTPEGEPDLELDETFLRRIREI